MSSKALVECVANISEGRDLAKIERISSELSSVDESKLLHIDSNADANRTVITFIGSKEGILAAALQLLSSVAKEIDISTHEGVHPRVGALDVCPFVALEGLSKADCVDLSKKFGELAASKYDLPVYLYRDSQERAHRKHLSQIRKDNLLGLEERINLPEWKPDYGPAKLHSTLGALVCGARPLLVAFNISLDREDLNLAKRLAKQLREEFSTVRAIGWEMSGYKCSQVSTNLESYSETNPKTVVEFLTIAATENGAEVESTELIGLIPFKALTGQEFNTSKSDRVSLCQSAAEALKLDNFNPKERVIELILEDH